ncbi:hypothetical protein V6C53_01300 [Desulfocurvibacter africanus]|uniref:Polymerase beta nucleotidyltransferase domain-containing protein n=1 Tax=Desulfocurvibacter africanus subsp. africanus str. Walvis Bay TaxID=690850 RepID=F3Z0F2_DESAF|nr:hypothetical protein [Desulfocurvibacter africanus]EGJ50962.1 hypothetical protein Desaf_2645 [Desulfocurvibacter africanus subsp. africanus str. Walvis Bay]
MKLNRTQKDTLKQALVDCLSGQREVRRIVLFGSFLHSDEPGDMDVAVFQDSDESYLPLAMKYRKLTRPVAERIALDIIPLKAETMGNPPLEDIRKGEVLYER